MFLLPVCGIAVLTLSLGFRCLSRKRIEVAATLILTTSPLMSVPEGVRRGGESLAGGLGTAELCPRLLSLFLQRGKEGMFINIWAAIGLGSKLITDVRCHLFGTLKLNFDLRVLNHSSSVLPLSPSFRPDPDLRCDPEGLRAPSCVSSHPFSRLGRFPQLVRGRSAVAPVRSVSRKPHLTAAHGVLFPRRPAKSLSAACVAQRGWPAPQAVGRPRTVSSFKPLPWEAAAASRALWAPRASLRAEIIALVGFL